MRHASSGGSPPLTDFDCDQSRETVADWTPAAWRMSLAVLPRSAKWDVKTSSAAPCASRGRPSTTSSEELLPSHLAALSADLAVEARRLMTEAAERVTRGERGLSPL